jgi:hypothetical protein
MAKAGFDGQEILSIGMYDTSAGAETAQQNAFEGEIDEIRVFNQKLTAADMVSTFSRKPTAVEMASLNCKHYFSFDSNDMVDLCNPTYPNAERGKGIREPQFTASSAPVSTGLIVVEHRVPASSPDYQHCITVPIHLLNLEYPTLGVDSDVARDSNVTIHGLSFDASGLSSEYPTIALTQIISERCATVLHANDTLSYPLTTCGLTLTLNVSGLIRPSASYTQILELTVSVGPDGGTDSNTTVLVAIKRNTPPLSGFGNRALSCDGVDDYLYTPNFEWAVNRTFTHADHAPTVGGGPITVEWWARVEKESAQEGESVMFSIGGGESNANWVSTYDKFSRMGRLMANFPDSSNRFQTYVGSLSELNVDIEQYYGKWVHYAITHDQASGTRMALLINGKVVASGTHSYVALGQGMVGDDTKGYSTSSSVLMTESVPGTKTPRGLTVCSWSFWSGIYYR